MVHFLDYGMLNLVDSARAAGNLVMAQCDYCGKKYGSIKEAQDCESKHVNDILNMRKDKNDGG